MKRLFVILFVVSLVLMLVDLILDQFAPWLQIVTRVARIACMLALIPAVILFRREWDRDHRTKTGCCTQGGYNLTGNASGICPECGTSLTSKKV